MPTKNLVVICTSLLIAGVLFWPGLYKYDHVKYGPAELPIRVNRLTGYTEEYLGNKWTPAAGYQEKVKAEALPADQVSLITGNAGLDSYMGSFGGKLYNGSDWNIKRVAFRVYAWPIGQPKPTNWSYENGNQWSRVFETDVTIDKHQNSFFNINDIPGTDNKQIEWHIESAYGSKAE